MGSCFRSDDVIVEASKSTHTQTRLSLEENQTIHLDLEIRNRCWGASTCYEGSRDSGVHVTDI